MTTPDRPGQLIERRKAEAVPAFVLEAFYERLLAAGKPKKITVACWAASALGEEGSQNRLKLADSKDARMEELLKMLAAPVANEAPLIVGYEGVSSFPRMGGEDHRVAKLATLGGGQG